MNIYGSLMDIFDQKNKDIFDSQKTKTFLTQKNKDIIDPKKTKTFMLKNRKNTTPSY